jgi:hypothetical protein
MFVRRTSTGIMHAIALYFAMIAFSSQLTMTKDHDGDWISAYFMNRILAAIITTELITELLLEIEYDFFIILLAALRL